MHTALIVLGNQLFPTEHLQSLKPDIVFMAEDLELCTHYRYHKQKIALFLAAMRGYQTELKKAGFKVEYIQATNQDFSKSYEQKLERFLLHNKKIQHVEMFEIEDKFFETRMKAFFAKRKLQLSIVPSPLFVTSREDFKKYLARSKKPFMKTFYEGQRKSFAVLLESNGKPIGGKWSYDAENRKKMPQNMKPPPRLEFEPSNETQAVLKWVQKTFKDHPGEIDTFRWPVNREQALAALDDFVKNKLQLFGDYQDAITQKTAFNFHSLISPALNMGLLVPEEVIKAAEVAYRKSRGKIPLASVEGFIRQVLGWREFVRGIYQNFSDEQWSRNFWNHQRKMKDCWYSGDTGIPILDDSIHRALKNGYSHHIERLMILSNFMLLTEIHPHEVHKWFMEMYCDSSDWVMGPNVFGMGQFSDGGIFATKPYICGSNYYLKMSDYKKGDWCQTVDGLYWRFIDKHKKFYQSNPRMAVMVKSLEKMDKSRKKEIFKAAESFIERTSYE